ncbi:hypothetical protein [Streptomyces sp. NPDC021622]|uniref:hypothetical protein n=1 Tax=Streptomyces sp. NPDC021622 TaxID=3155013 RepID=UPI00340A176C
MAGELQHRLMARRERQELDRMLRAASEVVTARTLASAEVPDGVLEAVRGFWSTSAEFDAALNDDAPDELLDSWVQELLARHGFLTSAFLFTDLGAVAAVIEQEYRFEFFVSHLT